MRYSTKNDRFLSSLEPNNPSIESMARGTRNTKLLKKTWDSDKAIKSTYKGLVGKYQLRAYLLLALAYGIVAAWLTEMPAFARKNKSLFQLIDLIFLSSISSLVLPPKYIDCTPIYPNLTNQTFIQSNSNVLTEPIRRVSPTYNYTKDYGRTVLTDVRESMSE